MYLLKIYDSFSLFTISLIYILYQNFEKTTVIKPFSTRPYSASRYVVCEKFIGAKTSILDYLKQFLDKYLEFIKEGKDVPYVLPTSEITKSEEFSSPFFQINSKITEERIDALGEIYHFLKNENIMKYDKMDIKMHCLTLWQIPVLKFDETKITVSGRFYSELVEKFKENLLGLYTIPKIIVFTSTKTHFLEFNKDYEDESNRFYNFGGIATLFTQIEDFFNSKNKDINITDSIS